MNKKKLIITSIFLLLLLSSLNSMRPLFQSGSNPSVSKEQVLIKIIDIEDKNDTLNSIEVEITNNSEYILADNVLHLYSDLNDNDEATTPDNTTSSKENYNNGVSSSSLNEATKITEIDGLFNRLQPGTVVRVELSMSDNIDIKEYTGLRFRSASIIDVEDNQRYGHTMVKKVRADFK